VLTAGLKSYYKPVTTTVAKANNTGAAVIYVFTRIYMHNIIICYVYYGHNSITIIAMLRKTGGLFPR